MLRDKRGKYFDGFDDELEALWFDEMVAQAERLPGDGRSDPSCGAGRPGPLGRRASAPDRAGGGLA
jgi:hypothetical protein